MKEKFDLISQMQLAALELNGHRVVGRLANQSLIDFILEPLKIRNKGWLFHNIL
jgi:hypothetical protein